MVRATGILASALIHGLLLVAAIQAVPLRPELPPIPTPDIQLVDLDLALEGPLAETADPLAECPAERLFRGIGISFRSDHIIYSAPEADPAFRAGVRVGDRVLSPDMEPDEAGYETLIFLRHGVRHRLRIQTQWICQSD